MTQSSHSIATKTCATTLIITVGIVLGLSGCKDSELDNLFKSGQQQGGEQSFCSKQTVPFAHTLCQVPQKELLDSESPLSLHLFWKSGQWQASASDPKAESTSGIIDQDPNVKPLYKFDNLLEDLPPSSILKFAVNAGMYNNEFAPIGYTVLHGKQILSLNLNEGAGNFHLLPNGVLWWDKDNNVHITESHKLNELLATAKAKPWYATQSGPMLVIEGKLHPKFNAHSNSMKIRNGVGLCQDGSIKFVTSNEPVNFYQFGSFFKDDLKCADALFLDGGVASAVYAADMGYKDNKNMGVMLGLIEDHSLRP